MNSTDFEIFLISIDSQLKSCSRLFDASKTDFKKVFDNTPYITFERTLSSYANFLIYKEFKKIGINFKLLVNEFAVNLENGAKISTVYKGRPIKDFKDWTKYCVVDGYFEPVGLATSKQNITKIFVEYKLQHKFEFVDLAKDFIKYKIITHNNELNTAFSYVVFDKNELNPTILSSSPHYVLMNSDIAKPTFKTNKRVYLYLPSGTSKVSLEDLTKTMDNIEEFQKYATLAEGENIKRYTNNEKLFLDEISKYDSRIVKASAIQKNYLYILNLWNQANAKQIFKNPHSFFKISQEKLTPEEIIKAGADYRDLLLNFLDIDDKVDAIKKGIRGSFYTSLFIISLFVYFNEVYKINQSKPVLKPINIGKGNKKRKITEEEIVENYINQLKDHFVNQPKYKLLKLCYSMLYYITSLYPLIYEIDEQNNVIKEKASYQISESIVEMKKIFRKLSKTINIKVNVDLEKIIFEDDKNELGLFNSVFLKIINCYL